MRPLDPSLIHFSFCYFQGCAYFISTMYLMYSLCLDVASWRCKTVVWSLGNDRLSIWCPGLLRGTIICPHFHRPSPHRYFRTRNMPLHSPRRSNLKKRLPVNPYAWQSVDCCLSYRHCHPPLDSPAMFNHQISQLRSFRQTLFSFPSANINLTICRVSYIPWL